MNRFSHGGRVALRPTAWLLMIVVAAGLLIGCVSAPELSWEASVTTRIPEPTPGARGLIVVAHGAHGAAHTWPSGYLERIRALPESEQWDVFLVNWTSLSIRYLSAAANGLHLGRMLGRELAASADQYDVIHLIGHSLGAHVIHGMAEAYRQNSDRADQVLIHATFLDPFLPMGVLQLGHGRTRFGVYADFAECYFTRNEPVWFSNSPLIHATNFDLTELVPERENPYFTYVHEFPLFYYMYSIHQNSVGPGFALSPFALGALQEDSSYDPEVLRELLPAGRLSVLKPR